MTPPRKEPGIMTELLMIVLFGSVWTGGGTAVYALCLLLLPPLHPTLMMLLALLLGWSWAMQGIMLAHIYNGWRWLEWWEARADT